MGRRLALLALLLLVGAAPAAASPVRLGPQPQAFWQIGADLFFATSRAHSTFDRWQLHRRPAGGISRVVATVDTDMSGNIDVSNHGVVDFFPTATHVAVSEENVTETGTDASGDLKLSFGPYGAGGTTLATCSSIDGEPALRPVAVDGPTIAYLKPPCDLSPSAPEVLVLHDAGGAADRTIAIAPAPVDVAGVTLAGGFAAYETGGSIFVVDRATGAPVYHVAGAGRFVLQADGKVAWATNTHSACAPAPIDWASPTDATAHALPVAACTPIRFTGDRIVYGTGTAIHVVTLAGADRTLLPFDRPAAVDAGRITFSAPGCAGGVLWTGSLDDPALAPAVPRSCPLRVTGRRLAVHGGAVRVPMSCPRGCTGLLLLGAPGPVWGTAVFRVTGRRAVKLPLDATPPHLRSGQRRTTRLTVIQDLPSSRRRTLRVAVTVTG